MLVKDLSKIRIGALWAKKTKTEGATYWAGPELRDEDVERLLEFTNSGPITLVVWRNKFKKTEKHPDAYLWLYRPRGRVEEYAAQPNKNDTPEFDEE